VPAQQSQRIKQLRTWHLSALQVVSEPMAALAQTTDRDYYTRAANEDCINGGSWTRTKYTYDSNHPYAVASVTNGSTTVYSASYDADGNMTMRNGYPITWTTDNLPESIASATGGSTFSYGPGHQRYYQAATFNGVTTDTTYIGGLFEVVATSTSTQYRHNIMAGGQVIAVHTIDQSGNATTSYLHDDHLGSVDTITNDQGTVAQQMSFDGSGLRRDAGNWDYDLTTTQIAALKNDTDRGFTFQEQLDNVGLIHMNGRVYDPGIGRFISSDPTVPNPLYSQSFNRFSYVNNSSLEYVDPSGFDDACPPTEYAGINTHGATTRDDCSDSGGDSGSGSLGTIDTNNDSPIDLGGGNVNLGSIYNNGSSGGGGGGGEGGASFGPQNNGNSAGPASNSQTTSPSNKPNQAPKQTPKQQPCNQSLVNLLNAEYNAGSKMQAASAAGFALAGASAEVPPLAGALTAASGVIGGIGIGAQGYAGWELYEQTGDITPFENATITVFVGYTLDAFGVPQPANGIANIATGNLLGGSSATCPTQ